MEYPELTTERLVLRCPAKADIDRIFAICQDPDIAANTTLPHPYLREHAVEFIGTVIPSGWETGTGLTWGIYAKGGGELLGVVSLSNVRDHGAELGYWLDPLERGRGMMTEAAERIVAFGFAPCPDGLGLRRIDWEAVTGNAASARVAQKLGFRYKGCRKGAAKRFDTNHDLVLASLSSIDDRSASSPWPE